MNKHKTLLFIILAFLATSQYCNAQETFIRAQVDSIVTIEVQKQLDARNAASPQLDSIIASEVQEQYGTEIELMVTKATQEVLKQYTTDENNRLTWVAIIVALLGVGAPLIIQRSYQNKLDKIEKRIEAKEEKVEIATRRALDKAREARKTTRNAREEFTKMKNEVEEFIKDAKVQFGVIQKQVQDMKNETEEAKKEAKESEKAAKASELFAQALSEKDLDKKIELYTKVLDLDSKNADALNNRGCAYNEKGDNDQAIKDYNEAIIINPKDAQVFYNRGNAYYGKKDYNQAIKDYDEAIRLNPKDDCSYCNKGMAHSRMYEMEPAIDNFKKAVERQPDEINNFNLEMGHVLQSATNFKDNKDIKMARSKAREGLKKADDSKDKGWKEIFQKFLDKLPPEK